MYFVLGVLAHQAGVASLAQDRVALATQACWQLEAAIPSTAWREVLVAEEVSKRSLEVVQAKPSAVQLWVAVSELVYFSLPVWQVLQQVPDSNAQESASSSLSLV